MTMEERFEIFAMESSDGGLAMMHKALRDAFNADEATPQGRIKPYGVRVHHDWRKWSNALEAQLSVRGIAYDPVPW